MAKDRPLMTVTEVAQYLRFHTTTIYRLVGEKKLPAIRIGGTWRFIREDLEEWCRSELSNFASPPGNSAPRDIAPAASSGSEAASAGRKRTRGRTRNRRLA
jgi:excisionase family DNA binding protein